MDLVNKIAVISIDFIGIWLVLWVYFANRKEKINRGFSLMVLSILSWVTFYYLASLPSQQELASLWLRVAFASVLLFFISSYYFFIIWFLNRKGWYLHFGRLFLAYGIIFALILIFTDIVIKGTTLFQETVVPDFSSFFWFLIFYSQAFLLTVVINTLLLIDYFKSPRERKLKIQYFIFGGTFIFAGLNFIFNIILPIFLKIVKFYYFGSYSVVFLLGFTAYAIVKRELFEIKLVLTVFLIGAIAVLLALDIFLFTEIFSLQILKSIGLITLLFFGYLLVKSVLKEIKYREETKRAYDREIQERKKTEKLSRELRGLNKTLGEKVEEKTKELKKRVEELERFYSLTVGRELKMVELKKRIKGLEEQIKKNQN